MKKSFFSVYSKDCVFPRISVEIKLVGDKYSSFYEFDYVEDVRRYIRFLFGEGMLDWFFGLGYWGLVVGDRMVWFEE